MEKDKSLIWDCGSSLYDSSELKSFMQQLDAAITSRCMSMPHLSSSDRAPPAPAPAQARKKQPQYSKFFKSTQKLLRSVFRVNSILRVQVPKHEHKEQAALQGASGRLASIPEVSEKAAASPEIDARLRKTVSERFTAAAIP